MKFRRRVRSWLAIAGVAAATQLFPVSAGAQSLGAGPVIGLKSLKFTPNKVEAKPGQKITFVWKEKTAHNIKFKDGGPASKIVSKGTFVVKFDKPGTYKFTCTIHAGMTGQVIVK